MPNRWGGGVGTGWFRMQSNRPGADLKELICWAGRLPVLFEDLGPLLFKMFRSPIARWVDHDRTLPSDCSRDPGLGTGDPSCLRDFVRTAAGRRVRLVSFNTDVSLCSFCFAVSVVVLGSEPLGFCSEATRKADMVAQPS